ncbi:uncharacterized protein LOC143582320 [Bidens hawaiensis]|uniref:uncharacterized protein LOC143582320 n=1 Tax=Bidens hawaiensis TaxID=980011 RepID=UPI00404AF3FB
MTFTDELSESSSSPGTKTPNLVARLMGLDILPEYSSPRLSTPATTHHHTRSLPTTPRMSAVSRRSTDNTDHHHHRLSLQINKENRNNNNNNSNNSNNNMMQRRSDNMVNRQVDHLKTQYAKEITNQVRERISRRLDTDITNTLSPMTSNNDRRRDSDLVLLKPNKSPTVKLSKPVKDEKIKRIASEIRYDLRLKNTTKKKSTALPKHVKNTTKVGCYKREMTSSSSTRSSQLKVSLPSKLNSSYKDVTHKPTTSTVTTTTSFAKGVSILQRLIEGDMERSTRRLLATAFAAEAEDIVKEVENEIMESLVHEIATETVV